MSTDLIIVIAILVAAIGLFASDRFRLDLVAVGVILALMLTGVLTPKESLAGFSATIVILIAALFLVGEGLTSTGLAFQLGDKLLKASGGSELRLLILLTTGVAFLSAFMSSTGAVAIFIPVALRMAVQLGLSPSRLLMPLAFGALIGGMLTLIGTPPNLVVSDQLVRAGYQPFGFFDFTPIGLAILVVTIAYMATIGRKLLPQSPVKIATKRRTVLNMAETYGLPDRMAHLKISDASPLAGQTLAEGNLRDGFGLTVMGIERAHRFGRVDVNPIQPFDVLNAGDVIFVCFTGKLEECTKALAGLGLERLDMDKSWSTLMAREVGMADLVIAPRSRLIGETLMTAEFRRRYSVNILAVQSTGPEPINHDEREHILARGDALLVSGSWPDIERLREETDDFVVLSLPEEAADVAPTRHKAPVAIAIVLAMLVAMTFSLIPTVAAALLAGLALVLSGCVPVRRIYRSINWESLVLIAAMLPMATALQKTGGITLAADALVDFAGPIGPMALIIALFLITAGFSQIISNTATTVLIAPIAIAAAEAIGYRPESFLMTVAIAASAAFATPVASPVNTLVLAPGRYRFMDFVRVGLPLQFIVMIVTVTLVPLIFPLTP